MPTIVLHPSSAYGFGDFTPIDSSITGTFDGAPVNGVTLPVGGYIPGLAIGFDDCLAENPNPFAIQTQTIRHEEAFGEFVSIDSSITGTFDGAPVNGVTLVVLGFLPSFVLSAGNGCLFSSLQLDCNNPPQATGGQAYAHQFVVLGGTAPYSFAIIDDELPPGLTLDTATGIVSGVPTQVGVFAFTVQVTDSAGHQAVVACSIVVICGRLGRQRLY